MQLRISNASPQYHHAPFNAQLQHTLKRPKNQPIFTYYNKQPPKNIYHDNNPYLLYLAPSEPKLKPLISTRNTNYTREISQNSSQRSLKMIRANGLRLAQKPKIGRGSQSNSVHGRPVFQNSRAFNDVSELREENIFLKQKLKFCQQNKKRQIRLVEERIESLMRKTMELQSKIVQNEEVWKSQMSKLKETPR